MVDVAAVAGAVVVQVNTASDSTFASRLPVAAATPVPAAAPAPAPIAAPLPPPAIPPMMAPTAAPPPIFSTLLVVCDSPLISNGSTLSGIVWQPFVTAG